MEHQIDLRGARCEDSCDRGPILKIDDKVFFHANKADLIKILEEQLLGDDGSTPAGS
jgi:NADH:ubiquinone oxidoreductase subunit E